MQNFIKQIQTVVSTNHFVIDIGSSTTRIGVKSTGKIIETSSYLAWHRATHSVIAIGQEAKAMVGKQASHIEVLQIVRDGKLQDVEATIAFLQQIFKEVMIQPWWMPFTLVGNVTVIISPQTSIVHKKAYTAVFRSLGAWNISYLLSPVALAFGLDIPLGRSVPQMIIDCGEGKTEISVVVGREVMFSKSIQMAGADLTRLVQRYLRLQYGIDIGWQASEILKKKSVKKNESLLVVRGRNIQTNIPESVTVSTAELVKQYQPFSERIVEKVAIGLSQLDPDLVAEVQHQGMTVCGGSSAISELTELLGNHFKTHIQVPAEVSQMSVRGALRII